MPEGVSLDSFYAMNAPYSNTIPVWQNVCIKAITMGISFASIFALLALAPNVKGRISDLGARTMTVYIFHGFTVYLLGKLIVRITFPNAAAFIIAATVAALAICVMYGNEIIDSWYNKIMNIIARQLLKE